MKPIPEGMSYVDWLRSGWDELPDGPNPETPWIEGEEPIKSLLESEGSLEEKIGILVTDDELFGLATNRILHISDEYDGRPRGRDLPVVEVGNMFQSPVYYHPTDALLHVIYYNALRRIISQPEAPEPVT